jgi:hypothetical protein
MKSIKERLLLRDETLWPEPNVSQSRLGWLNVADTMLEHSIELTEFVNSIAFSKVILLGMGGSSLGPKVLADSLKDKSRTLIVNDTTHPKTVSELDFEDALVVVSSKSGTTLEPNVLFSFAFNKYPYPDRYIAITDPGTPLAELAASKGFLRTFINPPDIGGRYSVLSYFGTVIAALVGYDIKALLNQAKKVDIKEACDFGYDIGEKALSGADKLVIKVPEEFSSFGLWIEQLIAESTGKNNKGVVPVPSDYFQKGADRNNTEIKITDPYELASEFYKWELATAVIGHVLQIDPFNEPNVKESKDNTNQVLDHLPLAPEKGSDVNELYPFIKSNVKSGDYISIQAYLPFGNDLILDDLKEKIYKNTEAPVTVGYGPRFLHSTGQLHKGGPNSLVAVQLVEQNLDLKVPIPDKSYGFETLIRAQAEGDLQSLRNHGRRVMRFELKDIEELNKIEF